jgi:hypothetical protein
MPFRAISRSGSCSGQLVSAISRSGSATPIGNVVPSRILTRHSSRKRPAPQGHDHDHGGFAVWADYRSSVIMKAPPEA